MNYEYSMENLSLGNNKYTIVMKGSLCQALVQFSAAINYCLDVTVETTHVLAYNKCGFTLSYVFFNTFVGTS